MTRWDGGVPDPQDLDAAVVHRLVAGQFPRWADEAVRPVSKPGNWWGQPLAQNVNARDLVSTGDFPRVPAKFPGFWRKDTTGNI